MGRWAAVLGALSFAVPASAQTTEEGLSFAGTTRLRLEGIAGQVRAGFDERDTLVNLRSTAMAQYREDRVRVVAELWDSRVYGDDPGTPVTTAEVNALELVQAFAEVRLPRALGVGSSATVTAGRFMINLGSRRLVAADDYRNTTNGYTGLRADLSGRTGWSASFIYVLPQQRRPDDPADLRRAKVAVDHEGFDLVLWGGVVGRAHAIGSVAVEGSFFHLGERDTPGRPTRDRSLDTGSVRLIREPARARVDGEVEVIVQRGHASADLSSTARDQAVRAWFVHADLGTTVDDAWATRLSIEYDHASGDRPGGAYGRFDTLFGMRRADFAPTGLYGAITRGNLISAGPRIEAVPDSRTDFLVALHAMWLAARADSFAGTGVRDAAGRSGRFAGTQMDVRVRHLLAPWLRLELDAALLAKGRFLRKAPNAPPGDLTRYLSLNATATF